MQQRSYSIDQDASAGLLGHVLDPTSLARAASEDSSTLE